MTIQKNTRQAREAIQNAREIRCYSLSNGFSGQKLSESPTIWGPSEGGQYPRAIQVSQPEFLAHELNSLRAKLVLSPNLGESPKHYYLHIHSNLWYEFKA